MHRSGFTAIGETIHCSRILKRGGRRVDADAILFESGGASRRLPIPGPMLAGDEWAGGSVRPCAAAIWQGMQGQDAAREAGCDYLRQLALAQACAGAAFLDVNVDAFSDDLPQRIRAMQWTAELVQQACGLPLSVDSGSVALLRAGLEACDSRRGRALLNSVSLERLEVLEALPPSRPALVVSAAGENGLPAGTAERLANLDRILARLTALGFGPDALYIDPLVYTISADPANGRLFLEAVRAIRERFGPEIHIVGGFSNVSFGLPARRLVNRVFARLAVEAGCDSGLVDPEQINAASLQSLDLESEPFRLARALLLGEDEFGLEFITAYREGRLA